MWRRAEIAESRSPSQPVNVKVDFKSLAASLHLRAILEFANLK